MPSRDPTLALEVYLNKGAHIPHVWGEIVGNDIPDF